MGTYVVGDIHGCYDEWIKLKNRIESQDSEARFVLIGDIVDRGPKVLEMLHWAMENITDGGKYQMILGNHEDMLIEWGKHYLRDSNRTSEYGFDVLVKNAGYSNEKIKEIIVFFEQLPVAMDLNIETGKARGKQHYIIVHAAIDRWMLNKDESVCKRKLRFSKQWDIVRYMNVKRNRKCVLWDRYEGDYSLLRRSVVIHGHTPTLPKGKANFHYCNINIDCGCVFKRYKNHNLCALRLEDLEEFYLYDLKGKLTTDEQSIREEMKNYIKGKGKRKLPKVDLAEMEALVEALFSDCKE